MRGRVIENDAHQLPKSVWPIRTRWSWWLRAGSRNTGIRSNGCGCCWRQDHKRGRSFRLWRPGALVRIRRADIRHVRIERVCHLRNRNVTERRVSIQRWVLAQEKTHMSDLRRPSARSWSSIFVVAAQKARSVSLPPKQCVVTDLKIAPLTEWERCLLLFLY